jgi:hypothetical protein
MAGDIGPIDATRGGSGRFRGPRTALGARDLGLHPERVRVQWWNVGNIYGRARALKISTSILLF